jgi:hypothetical protein
MERGFKNLEVDVTVTGNNSFKFCHPSQLNVAPMSFGFDSQLFNHLSSLEKVALWVIDIKYVDQNEPPLRLLESIYKALGNKMVICSPVPRLLTVAHEAGAATAQVFREYIPPELSFEPEYYIYDYNDDINMEMVKKSIVYCQSVEEVAQSLLRDAPYAMIDATTV